MSRAVLLAILAVIVFIISYVSMELGLTVSYLNIDQTYTPSFLDVVGNSFKSMWEIMTFQMNGVPFVINTIITLPLYIFVFVSGIEIIRGI